jgi:signal transduction histidine kinase
MDVITFAINHNVVLTAILSFGLGIWVYTDRKYDVRNLTLSALLVVVSLWSFAVLLWHQAQQPWQADFWLRTVYFVGTLLPASFLMFAVAVYRKRLPKFRWQLLLLLPNLAFGWLLYHQATLINTHVVGDPLVGLMRPFMAVHFAFLVIAALCLLLLTSHRGSDADFDRNRLAAVVVGTIIAFDVLFAGLYSRALVQSGSAVWVSNLALLVGIFIIAAAVVKRRTLVDLRLISVEIFVLVALSVLVTDLVVSQNLLDFTLRLVILVLLVIYGVMTIRSIIRETRRLRRMDELVEQVTQMNGRLLQADRTKTQFVSLASHQLRAPLGGMRNYIEMLLDGDFGPLKKKQKEVLESNQVVLVQALETIETFLNVAKAESGKLDLYRTDTAVTEVADRVVKAFQPVALKKGLALVSHLPSDLPHVDGDSGKLYHVLANLIDNAIKYTEKGSVELYGWPEGDRVRIEVKDTGAGLDELEKGKLFRVFSRGLSGVRLNNDGSGLGLFIVKKIVNAHGGEVYVESAGKGQGTRFSFTVPAYQNGES